ncbi:TetR/AcrR family transcriptional regulator [Lederbergia citri]|uniref:TetR/AcrR family transcriptional regulator C-terminal domain-containing protein n=1 Tax=Lederbergia citri TaxID=2833580 RepID=A0A942TF48_9BACI|nr:TetR/AcrR family transcriptional regulator C-terminal domain-containing protein [Lederbergia citri]MBS4196856.1 TetR/AcrR family transcriptional regulator C-terminal domain-containing protein [Lederbergia citri]
METKTDRRILRTKKAINRAFLELFTEKEFDRITINDISERADVNRGTFYLHYIDKYDLLDQCIDDHLNRMIHSCTFSKFTEEKVEQVEAIEALKSLFVYFEENFLFFSSMLSNKKTSAFRERMLEFLSSAIQKKIHLQGMENELIVQFMASAFVGTVESWILNHMPHPPQWMAEQIWTLFERNGIK